MNTTSFDYDNLGMLTDIELTDPTSVLVDLDYSYNDHGMLTGIDQVGLPGPASESFDYDLLGQLTTVNNQVDYGYDPARQPGVDPAGGHPGLRRGPSAVLDLTDSVDQ